MRNQTGKHIIEPKSSTKPSCLNITLRFPQG